MADFVDATGITWALVAASIGALVYWAWSHLKPKYSGYNIPPFPVKGSFLLGHLPMWLKTQDREIVLKFREKAGDVFSLDLMGNLLVVVSGYDAIKEVMVNRWTEAPNRPTEPSSHAVDEAGLGVINSEGELWKKERRTMLEILRSFGMGKNILAEKIQEEFNVFIDKMSSLNGQPVDTKDLLSICTSNIICSIIVGERFDHDDPHFVQLVDNLSFTTHNSPGFALNFLIGIARILPVDVFGFKAWRNRILQTRKEFSVPHINKEKEHFSTGEASTSYITSYLGTMQEELEKNSSISLSEESLIATIRGLFGAGTDTTSNTIYWCILLCLHHPEIQDKVYEEISEKVGHGRGVTINDKPNLPYLDAVIRETQRYASLVPILARKVIESFKLNGYTIPKDSLVILNMHSCHHDAKTWGDPEKFRPERFLGAKGNLINQDEFIPFGLGKRSCPGGALAKMELFIFMASLFQRFRFEPEISGELPPLSGYYGILYTPDNYKVRFVERLTQ
ncbi:cytochrome p450 2j5 [Plakobranchus ocellatus]|uniref:Cytochrome p450 2j5 n=1 Tax=Plakobranchus ocellatus TaxID=259542 RepID=A0AAV4DZG1_9GAST|nr:cytochrome p450 2j5 [Plakobranchus ocellatus]